MVEFVKLLKSNGTWDEFKEDWSKQCEAHKERFDEFATGTLGVAQDLLVNERGNAGAYGLKSEGQYGSMCQVNVAGIPGYNSVVMRVRHLIVSPTYDFGDTEVDDYAMLMARTLVGILNLSGSEEMSTKYINIHLRSPADRPFFAALGQALNGEDAFKTVQTKGSWLYITKS